MIRLKRSTKNLRWEEASVIYCMRHNLEMTFNEFADKVMESEDESTIDMVEFDNICKAIRKYDVSLTRKTTITSISLSEDERKMLLDKFSEDI